MGELAWGDVWVQQSGRPGVRALPTRNWCCVRGPQISSVRLAPDVVFIPAFHAVIVRAIHRTRLGDQIKPFGALSLQAGSCVQWEIADKP